MSFRLACFMLECFILASHCIHSVSCSHLPRSVISALAKFLCPDMPKLSMKSRAPAWPAPKRGKVRANMKKPAGQMKKLSAKPPCVPYTRVKGVQTKFRKERCRYGVSIESLTSMPAARLLQKLTEDGILPKWTGAKCPHCATGRLGPLHFFRQKQVWVHRCSHKGCQKRIQLQHDFHPIFFGGHGASITPLGRQAAVLLCALAAVYP